MPRGTPDVTWVGLEWAPSITTSCCLSLKKSATQSLRWPRMLSAAASLIAFDAGPFFFGIHVAHHWGACLDQGGPSHGGALCAQESYSILTSVTLVYNSMACDGLLSWRLERCRPASKLLGSCLGPGMPGKSSRCCPLLHHLVFK